MWRPRPNPLRDVLRHASSSDRLLFSAAVFSLFSTMGFVTDLLTGGSQPTGLVAANVLFSGTIALCYAWTAVYNPLLMIVPGVVHVVYALWIANLLPVGAMVADAEARRERIRFDAIGLTLAVTLGYSFFVTFVGRSGRRYVATQTEIALARDIHRVLVPRISQKTGGFEFAGESIASGDVGGDLVDVVELGDGRWMAYIADVSGHGVSSGLLMGMVKSAIRMRIRSGITAGALLHDLNAVLDPLKSPAMFVTVALVIGEPSGRLVFTLAGHLPILKIGRDGSVQEISLSHLPVGMMPDTEFGEGRLTCAPGDTLALVTDGLVEVFDRADREFGFDRLKMVLSQHREAPLDELGSRMLAEVRRHGPQLDDQTWLFIRPGDAAGPGPGPDVMPPRTGPPPAGPGAR